jgi:hypothetical protein
MVSANKFDCNSPAPVQKPVQVQGSTSKEYSEDVGGAVSHNWEYGRQQKRREQATCSHTRHCWDHSCKCGPISSTEVCVTVILRKWGIYRLRRHGAYFEPICACIRTRSMSSSLWQLCAEKCGQGLWRNLVITCSRTLTLWNTFGFKSVWLLLLGLSEGQSVQLCSLNSAQTEGEDQEKLCTGHKRNAHPCCTELCITSSSGSRVPRGSNQASHLQRFPYVKF